MEEQKNFELPLNDKRSHLSYGGTDDRYFINVVTLEEQTSENILV